MVSSAKFELSRAPSFGKTAGTWFPTRKNSPKKKKIYRYYRYVHDEGRECEPVVYACAFR